jgi:hypothetical protein
MKKLMVLLAALALAAAACGAGEDDAAGLPVNDGSDTPVAAGACLEGEPDCNDIPGGEPTDLPPPDDGDDEPPVTVLDVPDAVDATGPVTVTGFVVDVAGETRLCEALAESFPPQCGGASVTVTSLDQVDPDDLQTEGDVTWTDYAVTIFGEMVDGTLVATPIE